MKTTSGSKEVWYVHFRASNHMTSHQEWFSFLKKLEQPGAVETKDNTPDPIVHVGEVPFSHDGRKGKLMNVLHVPTITKNLVSVRHIVDQGMEERFTHLRCIEEEGKFITQGHQDGRIFIVDTSDVGTTMFAKG